MTAKKTGASTALTGEAPSETTPKYHQDPSGRQTAILTPSSDQIGSVQALPLETGHSEHRSQQVWRDSSHAVYKHFGSHGQFSGWEAILIKIAPARRIFGKDYPERETYPSNEDFGRYALSIGAQHDFKYAIAKAKTLKVKQRREGRATNFRREHRHKQSGTVWATYCNRAEPKHEPKPQPETTNTTNKLKPK
jgi:hypothetical protein